MTIIKKFDNVEQKKQNNKRYIFLTVIGLFFLIIVEIWVSNTVVNYGEKFENITQLQKTLSMENQILENEIAKSTSIKNIASKSAELGFSKVESIQYIR